MVQVPVSARRIAKVAVTIGVLVVGFGVPYVHAQAQPTGRAGGHIPTTSARLPSPAATPAPNHTDTFSPVTPHRILDTRPSAPVRALSTTRVHVAGSAGVPATGVSVVVVTVTVTSAAAGGHLTVFADGTKRPATSNVNFAAGQTVADQVYAPLGTDGSVAVYNDSRGSMQLIVDVSGYFAVQQDRIAGGFVTTTPTRLLDTRIGLGGHVITARSTLHLPVLGRGPVPASGVSAVAFTLTAVAPTAGGYLTAYTNDGGKPPTSNVNFAAHQTVANLAVIAVGGDGDIAIFNGSSGATQVTVDISGYFTNGAPLVSGAYVPIPPTRTLAHAAKRGGTDFPAPEATPTRGTGPSTAVLNVTVSAATGSGYVTVFPAGIARPVTSTLDFSPGRSSAGMAVSETDGTTRPLIHNGSTGTAQFSVDQFGYYIGGPDPGSIAGTTRDSATGNAVPGVRVVAYQYVPDDDDGDWLAYTATTTAADGTYRLSGLLAGEQYWTCFDTRATVGTSAFTGYAAQCYDGVPWSTPGSFGDDAGAALLTIASGSTLTGIDASLTAIAVGGVAGSVRAADASPIADVAVTVTDTRTAYTVGATTDPAGDYTVPLLPPDDYTVCFHATTAPSVHVPYGYLDRCEPAPVTVTAGSIARGDATLVAGGGISGQVSTASKAQIHFGSVYVFALFGAHASSGTHLNPDGTYTVGGLVPGPYAVCFDGGDPALNPPYGYADECYRDVSWAGRSGVGPPAGTSPVTVTAGTTQSGINAILASNGAVSGTVTDTAGARLSSIEVDVFDNSTGHPVPVGGGGVDADGTYSESGLAPSTQYIVCFKGDDVVVPPVQLYTSQCWNGVPWSGSQTAVPSNATRVVVTSGATTSGINATLSKQ